MLVRRTSATSSRALYERDGAVPLHDRHGPPPLRRGPVPLLRPPAARRSSPSCAQSFWPHLLPIARDWAARLGSPRPGPTTSTSGSTQCHAAGQTRPTPLMLRYGPGDWNALHRDLYGELVFPLQVVIGLDAPGEDYTGGEFVVVEQRPRAQSRATTRTIPQGHGHRVHHPRPADQVRPWLDRRARCATASARCTPASGTPRTRSSTTPSSDRIRNKGADPVAEQDVGLWPPPA